MNNKKLDYVSRTNEGESIDEQVYRIAQTIWNIDPHNRPDEFKNGSVYKNLCEVVKMAVAEEREACKEAAEEWSNWVEVDHAPMTLVKYIERERTK